MKVVIASDKFKGSLTSKEAADAIEEGLTSVMPQCRIEKIPIADGGDGTADAIITSAGGVWRDVATLDPLQRPILAKSGALKTGIAVLDVATASGIARLSPSEYAPLEASSIGTGIIIKDAIERGFRNFLIGAGGSATSDAAIGLLSALGFEFLDKQGRILAPCGKNLGKISKISDKYALRELKDCRFTIMCDVNASFHGSNGAARLFAPQKGADERAVELLDKGLRSFAKVLHTATGKSVQEMPFSGAAGGIGGALRAVLGAELTSGIRTLLDVIKFKEIIADADMIVTGEGTMDSQTLLGKTPYGICKEAGKFGIPVIAFTGHISDRELLHSCGFHAIYPITPADMPLKDAMKPEIAYENLRQTAIRAFRSLSDPIFSR